MMAEEPDRPAWRGMLVLYAKLKPLAGIGKPCCWQ